jgi:TolA-binding protein
VRPLLVSVLLALCGSGCASDAVSKAEVRTLQASVKQLQDDNLRLSARLETLETERAAIRAGASAAAAAPSPSTIASTAAPVGSEIPTLTVVKLKPRPDRAPPLDVRTPVSEPDAELITALAHSSSASAGEPPADAIQLDAEFSQASESLRTGNLAGGVERMKRFAEAHPRDARADDALYLAALGELGLDEPGRAAKLLEAILQRYPAGDVVQQAMLKLAECRLRMKQAPEARALLARVVTSFPGTPAASEAEARLARIPRAP